MGGQGGGGIPAASAPKAPHCAPGASIRLKALESHPVDRAVPPVIWVGQFAHLYVRFVSMKRMYIIVEAQGDWQSLSVSVRGEVRGIGTLLIESV